jgi:rare lipoprotein A (peptidoglycan hydrolase)
MPTQKGRELLQILACGVGLIALGIGLGFWFQPTPVLVPKPSPVIWEAKRNILVVSIYGEELRGRQMANGSPFDPDAMTCASRVNPLGSWVLVGIREQGKWVLVQVTDRMGRKDPPERSMDLSIGAARVLGMEKAGVAFVEVYQVELDKDGHFDCELPR